MRLHYQLSINSLKIVVDVIDYSQILFPSGYLTFPWASLLFSQHAHLQQKMDILHKVSHNWQKGVCDKGYKTKWEHIATLVPTYCIFSNEQMKYHWDRKNLLSVIFLLLCYHVSDLFLMLMTYVFFTVIATSSRYSRQLQGMLLNVIARSVMLLRG